MKGRIAGWCGGGILSDRRLGNKERQLLDGGLGCSSLERGERATRFFFFFLSSLRGHPIPVQLGVPHQNSPFQYTYTYNV